MHWAARAEYQHKVVDLTEEWALSDEVLQRFRAFLNERRTAIGKDPKEQKIGKPAKAMLAVYRKQFATIRSELSN